MEKPVVIEAAPTTVKLDLGCGDTPREGFEGVDLYGEPSHRVDLMSFPWPWPDSSVDELHCAHFVEHLPMVYVDAEGAHHAMPAPGRVDLLIRFFNECYRILKPGGSMTVITPSLRSSRAFQDPTHRRFIAGETYYYLSAEWRRANKLDHYLGADCNFGFQVVPTIVPGLGIELRAPEVQGRMVQHEWNTTMDFHATLKANKEAPASSP